jgi:hypothetical protein
MQGAAQRPCNAHSRGIRAPNAKPPRNRGGVTAKPPTNHPHALEHPP